MSKIEQICKKLEDNLRNIEKNGGKSKKHQNSELGTVF